MKELNSVPWELQKKKQICWLYHVRNKAGRMKMVTFCRRWYYDFWHPDTLTFRAERHNARMSKGTGCFSWYSCTHMATMGMRLQTDSVCFCFSFLVFIHFFLFLATCARLSWPHSAFQSTLISAIVSYRILSSADVKKTFFYMVTSSPPLYGFKTWKTVPLVATLAATRRRVGSSQ